MENAEWDRMTERTAEAFADPRPGDRFHEMYSWWLYVVGRDGDRVTTLESGAPCTFPDDGKLWTGTVNEFQCRFSCGSIPGYFVTLRDRGHNVEGWLREADALSSEVSGAVAG